MYNFFFHFLKALVKDLTNFELFIFDFNYIIYHLSFHFIATIFDLLLSFSQTLT